MWTAYRKWFDEYDASPKMKIDLQKYNLEKPENREAVLAQIDAELGKIRNPANV